MRRNLATRKATKKSSAKKASPQSKSKPSATPVPVHGGTYVVPRGNVAIAVPSFWTLRQTNDDLILESASGQTSVIVTAYHKTEDVKSLDAREYLHHYLEAAPHKGGFQQDTQSKGRAAARFKDPEGNSWGVVFLTNGKTLLLATCSSNGPLTSKEGRVGVWVLNSLYLKPKE